MAKKEIVVCDVCGEEVLEGRYCMDEGFSVNIPSPSGNIEVAVFADVLHQDICAPCMQTIYEKIFKKPVLSAIELEALKQLKEVKELDRENNRRKKQEEEEDVG